MGIILLLILIIVVETTVIVILRIRKQQYKGILLLINTWLILNGTYIIIVDVQESDGRVECSSTLAGIEQPNEAYAISEMLKKNIAYEQTKNPVQRQMMVDSPVLTLTEEGKYENIQPVHQYEEVLPHSQIKTGQYVN